MIPLGRQGFNTPDAAEEDAKAHLFYVPFCIVANGGDYGWVAPVEYAKTLVANGNIRMIWEHKERTQ